MRLQNLTLDHFKGVGHFEFSPAGRDADLYGDNATGKTTVADAYFWLLFGKDSAGNSSFDILPKDESGKVIDGLEASAAGKFVGDDGKGFSLRRVYHQVFTRKNGEAERKFKGNTTDFFINDVPKPQKDYQAFVAGICDEKTFRLLTDPDLFAGKMKWDERRDFLIKSFAPDLDDRKIISAHGNLKPLMQYIGYKSVEEYAEITKAQRRKINEQCKEIPGRIDEAEKAKPSGLPQPGDGPAMARLQKQKIQMEGQIGALRSGESASALKRNVSEVQAEIAKASAEYSRRMSGGNAGIETEAAALRTEISRLSGEAASLRSKIQSGEEFVSQITAEMDDLRKQCVDTFALEFNPADKICPTCGQEYPPEKKNQIQKDFNENKAEKLKKLEEKGKGLKTTRDDMIRDTGGMKRRLEADTGDLKTTQSRLDSLMKQYAKPAPFETTGEYEALKRKLDDAQKQLRAVTEAANQRAALLREQLENVTSGLEEIKKRALARDAMERQDKRIDELKKQEQEWSQLLANYDNGLLLAEQFTQQKARDIEEKVNGAFRLVRWKLFDTQVNGGIKPCCEATVNGIEYGTNLNSAARMNAGLDIIDTLSKQVGMAVPIWIDNAESVTQYLPVNAQVIRLRVAAGEKALRTEVQENEQA